MVCLWQKANELAWSPAKNFMMTGLMLVREACSQSTPEACFTVAIVMTPLVLNLRSQWMSGSGVHIFSIMITFYAVYNPVKSAVGVNAGKPENNTCQPFTMHA
jgi:hypothetical protein